MEPASSNPQYHLKVSCLNRDVSHLCLLNVQAKACNFPDKRNTVKWRALHGSIQLGASAVAGLSGDELFLHLPRERDAWRILSASHPPGNLVADLSQTVTRACVRKDGKLPTITPGSVLAMGAAKRILSPLEKVLLHGFPVHRMKFPPHLTYRDMESMGGNTMHVHVVGAAIILLLSMVDWSLPAAGQPCEAALVPKLKVHGSRFKGQGSKIHRSQPKAFCKVGLKRPPNLCSSGHNSCNHGSKKLLMPSLGPMAALAARWSLPRKLVIKQPKQKAPNMRCKSRIVALRGARWG